MSRFRKVDVRMWGDAKFRRLSPLAPSGQAMWLYLLTGPHNTAMPGLFQAGEMGLAEALRWPLEAFREAFAEAHSQGMVEADWQARVVWLPNALRYNQPESPNVVLSWRLYWEEIPECPLKEKVYHAVRAELSSRPSFLEAFEEVCGKPSAKPTAKPTAKASANHENENDNYSLSLEKPAKKKRQPSKGKRPRPPDELFDAIAEITGSDPNASGSHIGKVKAALLRAEPPYTPAEVRALPAALTAGGLNVPVTLGVVEKYIGWVRNSPHAGNGVADDERRLLARQQQEKLRADHEDAVKPAVPLAERARLKAALRNGQERTP